MSFGEDVAKLVAEASDPLLASSERWERVPLGAVATILNGFPWKSNRFGKGAGVPLIRIRDVTTGRTETHYDGPITAGYWVEPGDLLVGMDGDFNVRRWQADRGLLNQRVCKITADPDRYCTSFLEYVLPGYLQLVNRITSSVTVKHLSSRTLAEIPLPFPPLAEQRRIVAKLDALTARIARARVELKRIPVLATHLRRAVLLRAFSGELTEDWRVQHGRNISSWKRQPLSDIADVQGGIQVGKKRPAESVLVDTPYLRVANVQRGWLKLDEIKTLAVTTEERARLLLRGGDILMNEGGDRDKLGRGWVWREEVPECIHQNHVFRIRLKNRHFPPEFISHYANEFGQAYFFDQGTQTTNLASISKSRVMALPVPVPEVDEAVQVLRLIGDAFARADRLEAEAARVRALLNRLEALILAKAFRGELVPQDSDDEPAAVLLKRVHTERTAARPNSKRLSSARI